MSVSVIVPIYNEAENIALLHKAVTDVLRTLHVPYEILLAG